MDSAATANRPATKKLRQVAADLGVSPVPAGITTADLTARIAALRPVR